MEGTYSLTEVINLFDHLVGAGKQQFRHGESERLGGSEIDGQLNFRGLHDGQIGRAFALQYPAGIDPGAAIPIGDVAAIAYQAAGATNSRKK